jgi:multidrug efflux system membrane fusion protein
MIDRLLSSMGAALQALAGLLGDGFTLLVVALTFGLAAALAALVIKASSRAMRAMLPRGKSWGLILTAGALAAAVYLNWEGHGRGNPSTPSQSAQQRATALGAPVHVAVVEKKPFQVFINGLGTVQPTNMVTVRSRVDGQIEKVAFEEGQMVHEGDLLVQIDAAPIQAMLNQAVAKEAQDQASLRNAQQDLERTSVLVRQGNATQALFDQRVAQVAQVTAQIQADQAAIESARVQLNYTTIRAPLTGRVGFRLIDRGNIVHANDQNGMLTITQLQPISVIFTAPEQQLPTISEALQKGPLKVTAYSSDGKKLLGEGSVSLLDNAVDTASGTIRLKASFANEDNALWPGLSVSTRLLIATLPDAVVIPDTAVQRGPNGLYAYVVSAAGSAEMRPLKVGPIEGGNALIEEGLAPGERIVTSGHYRVQPKGPLQILQSTAPDRSNKEAASEPDGRQAQPKYD